MDLIANIFFSTIFGFVGIIFLVIGIYIAYKRISFKKSGIKTIFKVKDVLIEETYDEETGETTQKLQTIFEFIHNGELKEETISTKKEYNIGDEMEGLYLPDAKIDKISMKNEGFRAVNLIEFIFMVIGFAFIIFAIIGLFFG